MKIQLKRSDVLEGGQAKRPTPPNMKDGELAINFNAIDPSFFIKDTNGDIRKLGINDAVNVQADWSETNPGSPAYIKNKQLVTNELADLQSQIDLKIEDPVDNKLYGRKKGQWSVIEVLEANKDGNGYVRKDGTWYALDNYGYATETYADDVAKAAGTAAYSTSVTYTDAEIQKLVNEINAERFIREAPDSNLYSRQGTDDGTAGSWVALPPIIPEAPTDGEKYGRQTGAWVQINEGIEEASTDGEAYVRINASWGNLYDYLLDDTDLIGEAPTDGQKYGRQNSDWEVITEGVEEALSDGNGYIRSNQAWSNVEDFLKLNTDFIEDAQSDGKKYARRNGNWSEVNEGISDASSNGIGYVRLNGNWSNVDTYLSTNTKFLKDAAENGRLYARKDGQWAEIVFPDGAGVVSFNGRNGIVEPQAHDYANFYATTTDLNDYLRADVAASTYLTRDQADGFYEPINSGYITRDEANRDYQPKGSYALSSNVYTRDQVYTRGETDSQISGQGYITQTTANGLYAPANNSYITATEATNNFYLKEQTYTRNETDNQITNKGYITESYANGRYLTSTSGYTQSAANGRFVDFTSNQNITGVKRFRNNIVLTDDNSVGLVCNYIDNSDPDNPEVLIRDKFYITRDGDAGVPDPFNPDRPQDGGTGGVSVRFLPAGENPYFSRVPRIGIQTDDAKAALHVGASMRCILYENGGGTYGFDGQIFTGPEDGQSYFENTCFFHKTLVQTQPTAFRIPDTEATTTAVITDAERRVASNLRNALRGRITNGKRLFSIDKASLVSAFSDEGLDINDYGIIQEITQQGHEGYQLEIEEENNFDGVPTETFTTVDYQALFAFTLAAGPDLSAIESRLAALEAANS